jgi:hypothetical protein
MNIVLEGPDHGGKTTLGNRLSKVMGLPLIQGEGPPKSNDEFHARVARCLAMDNVIFDRHPCISEGIYGPVMGRGSILKITEVRDFFASHPFIIYVRPTTHHLPPSHKKHDHESQEHFDRLAGAHANICAAYDARMMNTAQYIYRRTDTHFMELAHVGGLHQLLNLDRRILAE